MQQKLYLEEEDRGQYGGGCLLTFSLVFAVHETVVDVLIRLQ